MEPTIEKHLIERAQRGDMVAYDQLWRAHKDALYHRVIRPRLACAADAEDVLVDTFATALENLDRFEWTGRSLYAWLCKIATNKCHDVGRRRGRAGRALDSFAAEPGDPVPHPDEQVATQQGRAEAQRQVEEVLALLNPRYADALRLRLLLELPREECAARLEVKLGTFDVLLLRAVRAFRKTWAGRQPGGGGG